METDVDLNPQERAACHASWVERADSARPPCARAAPSRPNGPDYFVCVAAVGLALLKGMHAFQRHVYHHLYVLVYLLGLPPWIVAYAWSHLSI